MSFAYMISVMMIMMMTWALFFNNCIDFNDSNNINSENDSINIILNDSSDADNDDCESFNV